MLVGGTGKPEPAVVTRERHAGNLGGIRHQRKLAVHGVSTVILRNENVPLQCAIRRIDVYDIRPSSTFR